MESKMNTMNLYANRNRLTDIENRLVFVKGEEMWRRDELKLSLADGNCYT